MEARISHVRTRDGFTLLEIIIYVAILGIILFFATGFVFNTIVGKDKITAWQEVNDSGQSVINTIGESVSEAQGVGVQ